VSTFILRRLVGLASTLAIVSVLVFLFLQMLPGDPARVIAGPEASAVQVQLIREKLGLNLPLHDQYWQYVSKAVAGDFGTSIRSGRPVVEEIGSRFLPTLILTAAALGWAILIGFPAGIFAATRRGKWTDRAAMIMAVAGVSLPSFALGLLLIQFLAVGLRWFPANGYGSWSALVLPSLTLGAAVAAVIARFTRSAFVEVMREDYLRTAYAKGLSERVIVWKHALRNALIPVVTMVGLQFGFLLGGAIVVEQVFAWPGLGRLLIDAVESRDYPIIQAEILLFSLEFIIINLMVDVLYTVINPAIRYR
jgi:glutathione transport system permease protein